MKKDVIIILAGGIEADGSLPEIPKLRVQKGVELFQAGVAPKIIMSGRWGFWLEAEQVKTEAEAMKEYAMSLGVPEEAIVKEEESKDTAGNVYFSCINILEPNNWHDIVVVTSEYHMPRTEYLFNKILGSNYKIDFVLVNSNLSSEKLEIQNKKEARTLEEVTKWLSPIDDGDLAKIKEILYTTHPAYSKNPAISKDELKKILGRQ